VINGKNHLIGRLSSLVSILLKNGCRIYVTNCDDLIKSGSLKHLKLIYKSTLNKKTSTNPDKGPYNIVNPSTIFKRTIRGMLGHKIKSKSLLMENLKCFNKTPLNLSFKGPSFVISHMFPSNLNIDYPHVRLSTLCNEFGYGSYNSHNKLKIKSKLLKNRLKRISFKKVESFDSILSAR